MLSISPFLSVIKDTVYPRTDEEDVWYAFFTDLLFLLWKILLGKGSLWTLWKQENVGREQRSRSVLCAPCVLEFNHALGFHLS